MARTGYKTIHFPAAPRLETTIEFMEKVQKKVTYLSMQISMKRDSIEIQLRGAKDVLNRALQEIKAWYVSIVKNQPF
ncbi:MAG: hypothetical protein RBG13Loki_2976 [Promethearchaeota archaeon CR_4]|nr:MAG: hypothetical protein RBG13Loki_2976 [Candidatus Lokiarchaeota archaeon CR_4]